MERRFQPVTIGEPTVEDTIAILRGLKPRYEAHHHGVKIKDSALVAAANLSQRYIADRFLPDKAIDLMDEATSRLAMEAESVPSEIDAVRRRRTQLELAERQLADETEEHAKRRRADVKKEIEGACREGGNRAGPSNGSGRKGGLVDTNQVLGQLNEAELQYGQLEAAVKEKQASAGADRRGRLPEGSTSGDMRRKQLAKQLETAEAGQAGRRHGPAAASHGGRFPKRSPKSSAPGPASPSAG